jgi:predicted neutral ceramidase superfamily lipid hydrolase
MLLTAVYTLFGAIIPTMIDEAFVYILLVSLVIFGLVTGLAFHAVYIRLFSVIVFLIKTVEKWKAGMEKYRVKKQHSCPDIEDSQPLQPDEMEEPESIQPAPGMAQAEGQQV